MPYHHWPACKKNNNNNKKQKTEIKKIKMLQKRPSCL